MTVDAGTQSQTLWRFVLNTRTETMGSQVCIHDLADKLRAAGCDAEVGDWDHYNRYDVAVFMGVDADIGRARAAHPGIRVVVADPKQSSPEYIRNAREGDLLLVSSIEQREAFLRLNRNILVYPMFPMMQPRLRDHRQGDELVLGYHGNKVHLEAMGQHVTPALEAMARQRPVRLVLMYNVAALGRAAKGLPDPRRVPTDHVQWREGGFHETLGGVDIGIVPNLLPIRDLRGTLRRSQVPGLEVNYEPFDYLMRFKASANPGRIAVFGNLGIPVITDFTPSACQMIEDGVDGVLAGTPYGWLAALEFLAESAERRTAMGKALAAKLRAMEAASFSGFMAAVRAEVRPSPMPIPGVPSAEEDLAYYRSPPGPGLASRVARRLRGSVARKFS